jgi:signal transduction histidine kinase
MLNTFKKQFQVVFEKLRDPLLLVDAGGHIVDFNPAARAALDIGDSEHIRDVSALDDHFVFDGNQMFALLARARSVFGFRLKDEDGNPSDVVADVIRLEGQRHAGGLVLVHVKDFATIKNYERWKDELISMVAHEIKNPLSAMKNSMNILISQSTGPVTEEQHKLLTTSLRGIDRLTRLLEGFLDVSRIGAGNYTLEPRWINADTFLPDVINSFKTLFNVRHQSLDYRVSEEIDKLYVDAPKLEQVLINLLSNAVKFTPAGGRICASVERANLEALSDDLRILPWRDICDVRFFSLSVSDTGIGMTGDTLGHLFTRWYKNADGGGLRGSHLGLSISKTLYGGSER